MNLNEAKGWLGILLAILGPLAAFFTKVFWDSRKQRRDMRNLELSQQRDDQLRAYHVVASERDRLLAVITQKDDQISKLQEELLENTRELLQSRQAMAAAVEIVRAQSKSMRPSQQQESAVALRHEADPTLRLPRPPSVPKLRRR